MIHQRIDSPLPLPHLLPAAHETPVSSGKAICGLSSAVGTNRLSQSNGYILNVRSKGRIRTRSYDTI